MSVAGAVSSADGVHGSSRVRDWARRRVWAFAAAGLLVAAGLFFGYAWYPILHHRLGYEVPGDIWLTFHGAQYTAWGDYTDAIKYVSTPGAALLLTPVALVVNHFHMTEPFPFFFPTPSAWTILGPYNLLVCSTIIFALDGLAERLHCTSRRRAVMLCAQAIAVFPVAAMWGHPEDVLAMSCAIWGVTAGLDKRWRGAGWWFGAAVVFQPLTLLVILPVLALTVPRTWLAAGIRTAVPTLVVMAVPLRSSWSQTVRFLHQPNWVAPNHPTPLIALTASAGHNLVVTSPERTLSVVAAAVIGFVAYRRRVSPQRIIWCIALAFVLRVVLEPVLDPYYLWPAAAMLLVAAMLVSIPRMIGAMGLVAFASVWAYPHGAEWVYWLPLTGALVLALLLVWRGDRRRRRVVKRRYRLLEAEPPQMDLLGERSPVPGRDPV